MGYIYLITNTINNMKYVGQSKCADIETRWRTHKKMLKDSIGNFLLNAYKKYGINNFKFQIICICFDDDCDIYEEQYIMKFNTIAPNGYNLKMGGKSSKHHESTKELIRLKLKERVTDEMRLQQRDRIKNNPYFNYGKTLTDEQKQTISDRQKIYWKSMSNDNYKSICNERKMRIHGENPSQKVIKALEKGQTARRKKIGKYNINEILLEEYNSISDASKNNNICRTTINQVCLGNPKYKTAGGFIWKFI